MLKPSLLRNCSGTILPIAGTAKEVHTFPKGICLKMNVITQMEFELAYYDVAVQHNSHYAMGDSSFNKKEQ